MIRINAFRPVKLRDVTDMWRIMAGVGIAIASVVGGMTLARCAGLRCGETFTVTSQAMCGGAGTFQQAVKDANASPGKDTIEFTAGLTAGTSSCASIHSPEEFLIVATEAVDIVGNGAKIIGPMYCVDPQGRVNNFQQCPFNTAGSNWLQKAKGVLAIGEFGQDNTGVDVTMLWASRSTTFPSCSRPMRRRRSPFRTRPRRTSCRSTRGASAARSKAGTGANITLRNVSITESYAPDEHPPKVRGRFDQGRRRKPRA